MEKIRTVTVPGEGCRLSGRKQEEIWGGTGVTVMFIKGWLTQVYACVQTQQMKICVTLYVNFKSKGKN